MKFPKRIKYRGRTYATIYDKSDSYPAYRVAWSVHGKRRMKSFDRFGGDDGAQQFAEKLCKDLAKGSHSAALSSDEARDATAALERLQSFYGSTGLRISLLGAVSEFAEAAAKLGTVSLSEAVLGYLRNVSNVRRTDLSAAVEEFIAAEEPRTKAKGEQRAQIGTKYAGVRAQILRRFAASFPNTAVVDLTKQHLDTFFRNKPLSEFSPKSRNHHRAAIQQFLQLCGRSDYLPPNHRLSEADGMRREFANTAEIETYTADEFRSLLEKASGEMQALIAIGGLAGLRTAELLRIDWVDVWRIGGHIEITARKSKTRQRRLVEICPALSAWLQPFREAKGRIWLGDPKLSPKRNENVFHKRFRAVCESAGVTRRENALRHSFCSYHYALHGNENLTAAQAGHKPSQIHSSYKALKTCSEGKAWFDVKPATADNIIPLPQEKAR